MKKILLFGMTLLLAQGLYSNPIVFPYPHINELQVYYGGHWTMEVLLYGQDYFYLDSVKIQNSAGFARVNSISFIPDYGYFGFYFTDYDLDHSILANEYGDVFTVTLYFTAGGNSMYDVSDDLRYGNVANPEVYAPSAAQSIERFPYFPMVDKFSLCNNPTPGHANDTTGTFGTMEGIVYDMDGQPVPNQSFEMDSYFTTDVNGHYSTRIYSSIFTWTFIWYEKWPGHYYGISITPLSYGMKPDSSITRNIHLLEQLLVGTGPEPKPASQALSVFPNPVKNMITVSYSTDLSATGDDPELFIYDPAGKMVLYKTLTNRLGVINLPGNLPDGLYLATLRTGKKILGSTRFVVYMGK